MQRNAMQCNAMKSIGGGSFLSSESKLGEGDKSSQRYLRIHATTVDEYSGKRINSVYPLMLLTRTTRLGGWHKIRASSIRLMMDRRKQQQQQQKSQVHQRPDLRMLEDLVRSIEQELYCFVPSICLENVLTPGKRSTSPVCCVIVFSAMRI